MNNQMEEESNSRSLVDLMSLLSKDPENIYPGGALEEHIQELEQELGTTLPLGYVEFQKNFGGGLFRHMQIYSIASEDENFCDFMEQVITHTRNVPLIQQGQLLPFADDYDSNIFCFDLHHSRDGEYSIVKWHHDFTEEDEPLHVAHTFAEFIEKIELIGI